MMITVKCSDEHDDEVAFYRVQLLVKRSLKLVTSMIILTLINTVLIVLDSKRWRLCLIVVVMTVVVVTNCEWWLSFNVTVVVVDCDGSSGVL